MHFYSEDKYSKDWFSSSFIFYFCNTLRSRVYKRLKRKHEFCSTNCVWSNAHLFRHPGLPRSWFLAVTRCWKAVAAESFIHHLLVILLLGQLPLFVYWTIGQFRFVHLPILTLWYLVPTLCLQFAYEITIKLRHDDTTARTKTTRRKSAFVYTRHTQVLCTMIVLYYPPPKIYEMTDDDQQQQQKQ